MALLPKVKLKAVVSFPATILDGTGVDVVKANGSYQFNLAYDDFAPPVPSLSDPINQSALVWNSVTGQYVLVPISVLIGSGNFFIQAGTGAVTRTMQDKARDIISVKDFGAVGDGINVTATVSITSGTTALTATGATFTAADIGKTIVVPGAGAAAAELITTIATFTDATHVGLTANAATTLSAVSKSIFYGTDNTISINAALAAGTAVFVPAGNYGISGTIQLLKSGNYLIGAGVNASILTSMSKSLPAVQSGSSIAGWGVKHLTVIRAPLAVAGGNGISQPNTNDGGFIEDVNVSRHFVGVALSDTAYSRFTNSTSTTNVSHGVCFSPTAGNLATYQWNLEDILSQANGGDGFNITNTVASQSSVGNWLHISTFANAGAGINAVGAVGKTIAAIRVTGGFFGQDLGAAEIILDTNTVAGIPHTFTDCQMELGTIGMLIRANNGPVSLTNCMIANMSNNGISALGGKLSVNGGYIIANAAVGVSVQAGRLEMTGCTVSSDGGTQATGIAFVAATGPHVVVGNDFNYGGANTSSAINGATAIATTSRITDNVGYNPVGMHTITVTASPFNYTAGPSGEDVFVQGGTVSAINVNSSSALGAGTNVTIPLGPYDVVTVAYTVAPTMAGLRR